MSAAAKFGGVLRRLDTLLAAVLFAAGLRAVPMRMICAEITCESATDMALAVSFEVLAATAIAILLWRTSGPWWIRSLVMLAAAYACIQGPTWLGRTGRWTLSGADGRACQVAYGWETGAVLKACGQPSYICEGPKQFEPVGWWNPAAMEVCSFAGMVYADRIVIMGCRGGVESVAAAPTGSPDQVRPMGCVRWSRPGDATR